MMRRKSGNRVMVDLPIKEVLRIDREKAASERRVRWLLKFMLQVAPGIAFGTVLFLSTDKPRPSAPEKIYVEGSRSVITRGESGDLETFNLWVRPANRAITAWIGVLSKRYENPTISFHLIADASGCGPKAIACADSATSTIYVCQHGDNVDRTTVMMHEIGHLLGVPHITDDKLMEPIAEPNLVLEEPTEAAVALAFIAIDKAQEHQFQKKSDFVIEEKR
jgi:hypothetical protein